MSTFNLPSLSADSGFYDYMQKVMRISSLTAEEEFLLAKNYRESQDTESAHKLVTSHLKLVAKIAFSFRRYGLPLADLVSEGNIGLMQAVKRFDPDKGFRLVTYAIWWIKASIQDYVLRSWSLVKIGTTSAQKKLFFSLGKIKRRILSLESREMNNSDYKSIASELDVPEDVVAEMHIRMNADAYLDDPLNNGDESLCLSDILANSEIDQETGFSINQENTNRHELLNFALDKLTPRENDIIKMRKLQDPPITLEEISKIYNISRERVRQIESSAFFKIQKSMIG